MFENHIINHASRYNARVFLLVKNKEALTNRNGSIWRVLSGNQINTTKQHILEKNWNKHPDWTQVHTLVGDEAATTWDKKNGNRKYDNGRPMHDTRKCSTLCASYRALYYLYLYSTVIFLYIIILLSSYSAIREKGYVTIKTTLSSDYRKYIFLYKLKNKIILQ
jgi:hypothetical protein